jgi:hypothetical protein
MLLPLLAPMRKAIQNELFHNSSHAFNSGNKEKAGEEGWTLPPRLSFSHGWTAYLKTK